MKQIEREKEINGLFTFYNNANNILTPWLRMRHFQHKPIERGVVVVAVAVDHAWSSITKHSPLFDMKIEHNKVITGMNNATKRSWNPNFIVIQISVSLFVYIPMNWLRILFTLSLSLPLSVSFSRLIIWREELALPRNWIKTRNNNREPLKWRNK